MKHRSIPLLAALLLLLSLPGCIRRDRIPAENSNGNSLTGTAPDSKSHASTTAEPTADRPRRSGSAQSQESRYLVLHLDWSRTGTGLTVTVSLTHYSISVGARDGGSVTVGTETRTFSTPAIAYSGNERQTTTLAVLTFPAASAPDGLPIYAEWNFAGTYHGDPIDRLTVSCLVEV